MFPYNHQYSGGHASKNALKGGVEKRRNLDSYDTSLTPYSELSGAEETFKMSAAASWVRKWEPITPLLTRASSIACHVPIHTVITVSMLAVFSYVHVLSDFQLARGGRALGLSGLREKQFVVSEQTQWNWAEVDVNKSLENAKVSHCPVLRGLKPRS